MKELRHKLFVEVTKEKRAFAAQSEEIAMLRSFKDDKTRELRNAIEDEVSMREKLQVHMYMPLDVCLHLSAPRSLTNTHPTHIHIHTLSGSSVKVRIYPDKSPNKLQWPKLLAYKHRKQM